MNILQILGRKEALFGDDIAGHESQLSELIKSSSFLVVGGAGTIGQAVTKEIFAREPAKLHVVDISENNLVELVRDIRSSLGYIRGEFKTFAVDVGSGEFDYLFESEGPYDYLLNLSALKHVRSEKDPYTLMRMIEVNILNSVKTRDMLANSGGTKYFGVSTDKAANPVNMMGATKRIMEMFLLQRDSSVPVSTARFANVAFSDGSLLHGFNQRMLKQQPIAAPRDVKRYFVTPKESGELCLLSTLLGRHMEIFFPKLREDFGMSTFAEIAERYLEYRGYEPYRCESEEEARSRSRELIGQGRWPCYFFASDTTGEKPFEEFYTSEEQLDMERFSSIGVIKSGEQGNAETLAEFMNAIREYRRAGNWTRGRLVELFNTTVANFDHMETGKFLDGRM